MSTPAPAPAPTCVWPHDDAACAGTPEVRGLCHRHYMRAVRLGIIRRFPAAEFFGEVDNRRWGDRARETLCVCEVPSPGEADECQRCHRLIASAERVADLQSRYRFDGRRWVRRVANQPVINQPRPKEVRDA